MARSLTTLMGRLIDYAGLFPPARLDAQPCVENYARYRRGSHAAFLGRLIWPASRLGELSRHGALLMPGTHGTSGYREYANIGDPWAISAVIDVPLDDALERIDRFNARHAREDNGLAVIDAVEVRADDASAIEEVEQTFPDHLFPFFEIPPDADVRGFVAALAGLPAAAKIRCGGITRDAFPEPLRVAEFLHACAAADVPFKATAGLHHAIRGDYFLTYDEDAQTGTMFGFINLFMAAALARSTQMQIDTIVRVLTETDPAAFRFTDECAACHEFTLTTIELAQARESFALSYGSCSFEEPVEELISLGLIDAEA